MTEYLTVDGGTIAYDVTGEGPLVVLSPGLGNNRKAYRHLVPHLVGAGYRVASMDPRGQGESSLGWDSYTRTDVAGDILALVRHLGGPALLVGHSFAGGSVAIAAAQEPESVSGIVQIAPFTRAQKASLRGLLTNGHHRKGMRLLMSGVMFSSAKIWLRYLDHAFPGTHRPADFDAALAELDAELRQPGQMAVVKQMGMSKPLDAGAQLPNIKCDALVVMGTMDPDWADPRAEAEGIVAEMPEGRGAIAMIDGAGHYPHTQYADEVAQAILPFLAKHASRA